jgi:hypothetical protein
MRSTAAALMLAGLAVSASAQRGDAEDYHFQKAIPRVMADAVPGLWTHEFAAFDVPLFGGCYGSSHIDTADQMEIIQHCDATAERGATPALAGFHAVMTIDRVRAPHDRWVMDVEQPGAHFRSTFIRTGACPAGRR